MKVWEYKKMREFTLPFLFLFLVCFCAPRAGAQVVSGNIIGTVTDPEGRAVAGVKVTIHNVDKNITTDTTTNDSGNYTATQLTPGNYEITVEKQGFNRFVQQNIRVTVGLSTRVDAQLQLGPMTQEITVTSAPPGLQTTAPKSIRPSAPTR